MAVKDILERIEGDASESLRAMEVRLDARLDELAKHRKARLKRMRAEGAARAEAEARREKERRLTMGRLELRKADLAERRARIDEAFRRARGRLLDLDDDARRSWIRSLVLAAGETGREGLRLAARDRRLFGKSELAELNRALVAEGREGGLHLVDEGREIEGGCLLVAQDYDVDRSLDALLAEARDELEETIADLLFREDEAPRA